MTLTVPLVPPSPNILRRTYRNPHAYMRLRKLWEGAMFFSTASAQETRETIQAAQRHAKMRVTVTIYHSRQYDTDNLTGCLKPVLDALKNIGFIANDDPAHLELFPPVEEKCARKDKRTVVTITPA